jgi:uncharacterized protein (DUF1800 family)
MQSYLARNRFGLGWRAGDAVTADPTRLTGELARYDPAPAAVSALMPRGEVVAALAAYRDDRRSARDMPMPQSDAAPGVMATSDAAPGDGAMTQRDLRRHYVDAAAARVQQAVTTDTSFAERLVHFWSNHFAVSVQSLPVAVLAGDHENRAIRPHVMGKFSDLLRAAVLSPAMLLFLDQAQSVGPGSDLAKRAAGRAEGGEGRKPGLNENLAREILELHTLGVRSVYAQGDVTALARVLTGWTVAGMGQRSARLLERMGSRAAPGDTVFIPVMHEPGAQTIVGRRFAESGAAQSHAVLDHLAAHPATARHVATKLARHFAADVPPPALVTRLERAFLTGGGDLPTLYRVLIDAPECWQVAAPKFKTPWEWTISMLRATGQRELPDRRGAVGALMQLGQPIWQPGSPAGYDDIADRWAGPSGLMLRAELAARVAGGIAGRTDPRALAQSLLGDAASAATLTAVARADSPAQGVVLALMSPEFLRR